MSDFTLKEIRIIIALLETQKQSVSFLRGFAKPTDEEQKENQFYNNLIDKVNKLKP